MFDWQEKIPAYLTEKSNIVRLIIFTAAFALVFINIYAPFGVYTWFDLTQLQLLAYSSLVILAGVLVVVISRVLMYRYCRKEPLTYPQYIGWVALEILSMALVYTIFETFILDDPREFITAFKVTLKNTALVLLLPYSTLWLYFSWREKKQKLEIISAGGIPGETSRRMIPFYDEKGALRISIMLENLIYLEASDNYVTINYLHKDKTSRFMVRNTLKNLETTLSETGILRCHRSFMVNIDMVKVIRREKGGLKLEIEGTPVIEIPVSKTYMDEILAAFSKYSL